MRFMQTREALDVCMEKLADPAACAAHADHGNPLFRYLSTNFGKLVFSMFFLTWGLIIVVLTLETLFLVHKIFGKRS